MRILLALALVAACGKGKPTNQDQPPAGSAGSAGSAVASGSAAAPTTGQAPDVALPPVTGTPPNKAKALDEATLKSLAALTYPGWTPKPMQLSDKSLIIRHTTASPPKMTVTIQVRPCSELAVCLPIDLAKWQADPKFNDALLGPLKDAKDTIKEVAMADFNGVPMISSFVLGQAFGLDANGNTPGSYKYAWGLYYNDGTNMIQVVAGYGDMPLKTKELMQQAIPREDLEKAARAFMDAFTHAW